jgi:hypothetical protein
MILLIESHLIAKLYNLIGTLLPKSETPFIEQESPTATTGVSEYLDCSRVLGDPELKQNGERGERLQGVRRVQGGDGRKRSAQEFEIGIWFPRENRRKAFLEAAFF